MFSSRFSTQKNYDLFRTNNTSGCKFYKKSTLIFVAINYHSRIIFLVLLENFLQNNEKYWIIHPVKLFQNLWNKKNITLIRNILAVALISEMYSKALKFDKDVWNVFGEGLHFVCADEKWMLGKPWLALAALDEHKGDMGWAALRNRFLLDSLTHTKDQWNLHRDVSEEYIKVFLLWDRRILLLPARRRPPPRQTHIAAHWHLLYKRKNLDVSPGRQHQRRLFLSLARSIINNIRTHWLAHAIACKLFSSSTSLQPHAGEHKRINERVSPFDLLPWFLLILIARWHRRHDKRQSNNDQRKICLKLFTIRISKHHATNLQHLYI